MRHAALFLASLALPFPMTATAQEATAAAAPTLTFERVFASPSLDGPAPRAMKLSPDGKWLTLLRNRADDRQRYDLWGYERATGQWRMLVDSLKLGSGKELSEAEKMQRERQRIGDLTGIVTYSWTADGKALLVPLDGELYLAALDGTARKLDGAGEGALNPALSPKGGYVSFVKDRRLWAGPVGAAPQPITPAETAETVHWGEAEFVAQEELDRSTGTWWSPDDKRIAVERFDEAPVNVVTRAAIGADGTKTFAQRYPAAGTPNADVSLHLVDPDGGHPVTVDLGGQKEFYLARVDWAKDGKTLFVQVLDRPQSKLDMLAVDPATGKSRVLFTEHAAKGAWINLGKGAYRWLADGSLVWTSERSGFAHLYRYKAGKWTQLTKGDWVVTGLVGVDEAAGRVFFTATKDDPLAANIYAVPLAGGAIARLGEIGFNNAATMDTKGQTLIVTRSNPRQPPQSYLADAAGKRLTWIEENRVEGAHPYAPFLAAHRDTSYGTLKAADGSVLHWNMITPPLVPGKRYPVFFSHYGGPHSQQVVREWTGQTLAQAIVARGYIWFEIDNRGSANRGVEFEKQISRAMGSVEVADQKVGAEYLKTLDFVDPKKIATYGWSYGGYMTLMMLAKDPGEYAAGIAVAPVTRWDLYDTAYTERYLGDPRQVPEVYKLTSPLTVATQIRDPLLVVHGMADDNVVLDNTTALAAKLQDSAVPFEMMLYPGKTHSIAGPKTRQHLYESIFAFLERHGITPNRLSPPGRGNAGLAARRLAAVERGRR